MNNEQRHLITAGTVLGIGLGGFVDGILFHQILQVHGMISGRVPKDSIVNLEINMFWDGLFHTLTWLMTALGVWLLFRLAQRRQGRLSGRMFGGALAVGWGLFQVVDWFLDHHVLNMHHVVERLGVSIYDGAFLAFGVILLVGGALAIRPTARG